MPEKFEGLNLVCMDCYFRCVVVGPLEVFIIATIMNKKYTYLRKHILVR